ncbi:T9SS type A sorting domain-containing protein [Calditrichota bacterium GD2]
MKIRIVFLLMFVLPFLLKAGRKFAEKKGAPITDYNHFTIIENDMWRYWIDYQGSLGKHPLNTQGGFFTVNKVPVIFLDGFVWGGMVEDSTYTEPLELLRVGGITYRAATIPGRIVENNGRLSVDPTFQRLFKVRKNWRTLSRAQLEDELRVVFQLKDEIIPEIMVSELRNWYADNWKNWPTEAGAPFNDVNGNGVYDPVLDENGYPISDVGDYPGIAEADQVVWLVVNDLDQMRVEEVFNTPSIGLEVQITLWTYESDFLPLSQTVFERYVVVNKSDKTIENMYFSKFVDPDLGDYGNDLVGCDSTLNLGYVYNASFEDFEFKKYRMPPAVVGFGLLQGPVVQTDNPLDTAMVNFEQKTGYRNLPMSSFNYLAAGSNWGHPDYGIIEMAIFYYNLMRGYAPYPNLLNPLPMIFRSGPQKGQITRFPLSGDPVNDPTAQWGDIDGQGENLPPGDRRLMINVGPFTMKPHDRQEVIYAVTGGVGNDHRQGIVQLKSFNKILKDMIDRGFGPVNPEPPAPRVKASPFDEFVVLNWGWDVKSVEEIEKKVRHGYRFEGYNVYQLPDSQATLEDSRTVKLATFDLINGVYTIEGLRYLPDKRRYARTVVQEGTDSGIQYYFIARGDSINGRPFYRGSTYYFAVTSYNYNPQSGDIAALESDYQLIKVTVQPAKPGNRYLAEPEESIEVTASHESDFQCQVQVVDPAALTGHQYQVYFTQDEDTTSETFGQWLWNLKDVTLGADVLKNQPIKTLEGNFFQQTKGNDFLIIDGLQVKVWQPPITLKTIVQVADAEGPLTEDEFDARGAPYGGNYVWQSLSSPNDANRFYLSGGEGGSLERIMTGLANAMNHDFELRFTESGGYYLWWAEDSNQLAARVPFEAWDVGRGTYDDATDDIRCLTGGYSGGATPGVFDFAYQDPAFGFPATDWIDIRKPINEQGSYQAFAQDIESGVFSYNWWANSVEILSGIIICDYGGAATLPPTNTVIRFITTKGPDENLTFTFNAPGKIENDPELMKKDVEKINVFPNPYYAASSMEPDRFTHFVTFNHLPPHAVIRIFTLNGVLVRKLEKRDDSQFFRWDLKNEKGWRVASGLYIVHIDMPELGKQKVLKLMVISGEETLDYY